MAEIIKQGDLAQATCNECKCEFRYKQGEIRTDYPPFARRKFIWCPCCNSRVVIRKDYY